MRQQEMENKEPMDQSPEETVETPAPEAAEAQEPAPEEEAPQPAGEAEKLQEALREKEDQYLRLLAEYDNYRKRSQKEKENAWATAKAETIKELLPVYDNLERALKQETCDEAYAKGVDMTPGPSTCTSRLWKSWGWRRSPPRASPLTPTSTTPSCTWKTRPLEKISWQRSSRPALSWGKRSSATPWSRWPTSRAPASHAPVHRRFHRFDPKPNSQSVLQ